MRGSAFYVAAALGASSAAAAGVFDVIEYGAKGDGATPDTAAIRAAAAALKSAGGGTLRFCGTHTFLTGAFNLTSNTVVEVCSGATIMGHAVGSEWPLVEVAKVWRWFGQARDAPPGTEAARLMHQALIFAWDAVNITVTGGGSIDGNGAPWWGCDRRCNASVPEAESLQHAPCDGHARPQLLFFSNVTDVSVRDITARSSPDWCFHFGWVTNLHVRNVSVHNPPPERDCNTDGVDLDAVQNALVEQSFFDVSDDAVCVKSGIDWFGRKFGRPSRDILVRDIHIKHGAGPTVGSEMSGGVYNVTFERITLHGAELGPCIKSSVGRGGEVAGVTWRNVSGSDVGGLFGKRAFPMLWLNLGYEPSKDPPAVNSTSLPLIRDILFEGITFGKGLGYAATMQGLPQLPVRNVTLRDVRLPKDAPMGPCEHVEGRCEGVVNRCPPCFEKGEV